MMKKRLLAIAVGIIMAVSTAASASAETLQPVFTSEVTASQYAGAVEWNGKTELKANTSYTLSKSVTVSQKVVVPSGTTLTILDGGKLTVGSEGKLYIKGKVSVKSGAQLAVNGTLYQYKGKVLVVYGTASFGTKSKISLMGKLTVPKGGVIKGTPASLSISESGTYSISGKNTCAKLTKAIDKRDVKAKITEFYTIALVDGDVYGSLSCAYPKSYITKMDKVMTESGMTLKEYCDKFGAELFAEMSGAGIRQSRLVSADAAIKSFTDVTSTLSAEKKAELNEVYGSYTRAYSVTAEMTVTAKGGAADSERIKFTAVLKSGKWYIYG